MEYPENIEAKRTAIFLCASNDHTIWFHSDVHAEINSEITLISEEPHIRFDPILLKHTGFYYCYGTYSHNHTFIAVRRMRVYGKYAVLSIYIIHNSISHSSEGYSHLNTTDNIRVDPRRQSVRRGTDVLFHCDSYTKVTWSFDGGNISDNSHVFEDNSLVIYDVEGISAGLYECEGRNKKFEKFFGQGTLEIFGELSI